jgi:TolB protein
MQITSRSRTKKRLFVFVLVLGSALLSASPAQGAYPGSQNGRLAYGIRVAGNVDIYTSLPNGDTLRRLTTSTGFDACPAYSADGKLIAYCSNASGAFEIWVMKANGTDLHQVTHMSGRMLFPDFDPTGKRIAFGGGLTDESPADIFSIGTDGTGLAQLTSDGADDLYPAYSPDGSQIAFISYRTGTGQVWLMNADGSNERQLTFDAVEKDQVPDWSPDGSHLAYAGGVDFGPFDLYVIDAEGGGLQQITSTAENDDFAPTWSPDGTEIAFVSARSDGRFVYIVGADGTGERLVNGGAGPQFAPAWQPLGDRR